MLVRQCVWNFLIFPKNQVGQAMGKNMLREWSNYD